MKHALFLLVLMGFALPAQCQQTEEPAPAVPITPAVLPPEVPPRPPLIAVPPTVTTDPQTAPPMAQHKEPLAWRGRAHKLRLSNTAQRVQLQCGYDAAIMGLVSLLPQVGLRVQTLNSKAGELLAVPIEPVSSQRFIFTFAEMPPGTVTIKAAPWSQDKAASAQIDAIFQSLTRGSK